MKKFSQLAILLLVPCLSCAGTAPSPVDLVLRAEVDPSASSSTAFELGGRTMHFGEPIAIQASSVHPTSDSLGRPAIGIEFAEAESARISEWTQAHIGGQIGIFLGDQLMSAPTLNSELQDSVIIQSDFTPSEVQEFIHSLQGK